MTQEEKAKADDEVLEKIKEGIKPLQDGREISGVTKGFLEEVFPELKESEDERIRKALIKYLDALDDDEIRYGVSFKDMRTWLEKQGEQKLDDKVESKFKVGDWITDNSSTFQIVRVEDEWYYADDGDKVCFYVAHEYYHLWTIQDAENGDVLCGYPEADYPWIGIFHKLNAEGTFNSYCYLQAGLHGKFCPQSRENIDNHSSKYVVPATKIQCDLLFQKMKESGYKWDEEKKELRKIEQNPTYLNIDLH